MYTFMNPTQIMAQADLTPFAVSLGGRVPIFTILDSPLGTGVQATATIPPT